MYLAGFFSVAVVVTAAGVGSCVTGAAAASAIGWPVDVPAGLLVPKEWSRGTRGRQELRDRSYSSS
jgi:hypothetical protein